MAAKRKRRPKPRPQAAPGWLWLAAGFALGLIAAFGLYVTQRAAPVGERDAEPAPRAAPASSGGAETAASRGSDPAQPAAASRTDAGGAASGAADSGSATSPAAGRDEPRFQFYELLPEFEVVVPDVESPAGAAPPPAEVAEPGRYMLQVGSFTKLADADRMQASLALLGIESRLQRVAIDDQVYHRVRVGPLSDLDRINEIRNRLRDERIDSLLMRAPAEP